MKRVRKVQTLLLIICMVVSMLQISVYGSEGDMGFFGGISEGEYLPRTAEENVPFPNGGTPNYSYKEVIFITGEPIVVTGTILVDINDAKLDVDSEGLYTEKYTVSASNADKNVTLNRTIELDTIFEYKEGVQFSKQLVKNSQIASWSETITTDTTQYSIDRDTAIFSKSTVEHITPGVTYYSTLISYSATFNDAEGNAIDTVVSGEIYGFKQPWSTVETQQLVMNLQSDPLDLSMEVILNPRIEAKKSIYYDENEPFPISFGGTYNQRMEKEASLDYKVTTYHPELTPSQLENSVLITTANILEKLPIPEGLDFIEGHWAEDDIKKLYSMEILTEPPHDSMQFEAMSRGSFVKALCLAMNIDTSAYAEPTDKSPQVFGDVNYEHPLYKYVMGAYDAKLVEGTGENFDIDVPITRQEAFVIYIRVIGLERLGVTSNPITPFVDDAKIADWAKREIAAGVKLGIIQGDNGYVKPLQWISKAEAAAIINRLVDYLREEIGKDY